MTIRTILAAAALTLLPTLAVSQGCSKDHGQQAMSCADGTQWDAASGTCIPVASS